MIVQITFFLVMHTTNWTRNLEFTLPTYRFCWIVPASIIQLIDFLDRSSMDESLKDTISRMNIQIRRASIADPGGNCCGKWPASPWVCRSPHGPTLLRWRRPRPRRQAA